MGDLSILAVHLIMETSHQPELRELLPKSNEDFLPVADLGIKEAGDLHFEQARYVIIRTGGEIDFAYEVAMRRDHSRSMSFYSHPP